MKLIKGIIIGLLIVAALYAGAYWAVDGDFTSEPDHIPNRK